MRNKRSKASKIMQILTSFLLMFSMVVTSNTAKKTKVSGMSQYKLTKQYVDIMWNYGGGVGMVEMVTQIHGVTEKAFCTQAFAAEPGTPNSTYAIPNVVGMKVTTYVDYNSPRVWDNAMARKILYYGPSAINNKLKEWLASSSLVITNEHAYNTKWNASAALCNDMLSIARNGGSWEMDKSDHTGSMMTYSMMYSGFMNDESLFYDYIKPFYNKIAREKDPKEYGYEAMIMTSSDTTGNAASVIGAYYGDVNTEAQDLAFIKKTSVKAKTDSYSADKSDSATYQIESQVYKKADGKPLANAKADMQITHGGTTFNAGTLVSNKDGLFVPQADCRTSFTGTFKSDRYNAKYITNWSSLTRKQQDEYLDDGYYKNYASAKEAVDKMVEKDLNDQKTKWLNRPVAVTLTEKKGYAPTGYYQPDKDIVLTFTQTNGANTSKIVLNNSTLKSGTQGATSGSTMINTPDQQIGEAQGQASKSQKINLTGNILKKDNEGKPVQGAYITLTYKDNVNTDGGVVIGDMKSNAQGVFEKNEENRKWNNDALIKWFNSGVIKKKYVKNWSSLSEEQKSKAKAQGLFDSEKSAKDAAQAEANTAVNNIKAQYNRDQNHGIVITEYKVPDGYEAPEVKTTIKKANLTSNADTFNVDITSTIVNKVLKKGVQLTTSKDLTSYVEVDMLKLDKDTQDRLSGGTFEVWVNITGKDSSLTKVGELSAKNGELKQRFDYKLSGQSFTSGTYEYYTNGLNGQTEASAKAKAQADLDNQVSKAQSNFENVSRKVEVREVKSPEGYKVIGSGINEATINANHKITGTIYNEGSEVVLVSKEDSAGIKISGAKLKMTFNGKTVDEWVSDTKAHEITGLKSNTEYTITETVVPEGYIDPVVKTLTFTTGPIGAKNEVAMKNASVSFRKIDVAGKEIEGAKMCVKEKDTGKVVDEWVSTTDSHLVKGLKEGKKYILEETLAPLGYNKASSIEFTAGKENQQLEMIDYVTTIVKTDTKGDRLEGAILQILDKTGKVVDEWATKKDEDHKANNLVTGQQYILHEKQAPQGYTRAKDIEFTAGDKDFTVTMVDRKNQVIKQDLGGLALSGATLQIKEKKTGKVIDEWVSTTDPHPMNNVMVGETYILHEVKAPDGYCLADDIEFTVDESETVIKMVDVQTMIAKVDKNNTNLAGAKLKVLDMSGNVIDSWTTDLKDHNVKGLHVGQKYILREELAPDGYIIAKDIEFIADSKKQRIVMEDKQINMSKKDVAGKEVEGAKIRVYDEDNNIVDEWVSTKELHAIKNLVEGKKYRLHEEVAPNGYVYANDIEFIAGEEGKEYIELIDTIQTVVKQDEHGNLVKGAKLQLVDKKTKEVVDTWVSGQQIVNLTKEQTETLVGNMESVKFEKDGSTYEIQADTKMPIKSVESKDFDKKEIEAVKDSDKIEETDNTKYQYQLVETKADGTKNYYYVDETGAEAGHRVSNAIALNEYEVQEVEAPKGYVMVAKVDITPSDKENLTNIVIDKRVKFTKIDVTGDEVEGAKIQVIDQEGKVIDEWISEKEPHYIENLEIGKKYKLVEQVTPNGYTQASAIDFEVTEDGIDAHYKMVDAIHRIIKVNEDGGTVKNARLAVYTKDKKKKVDEWVTGQHIVDISLNKLIEAKSNGEAKLDDHDAIAVVKDDEIQDMKKEADKALALAYPSAGLVSEGELSELKNPKVAEGAKDEDGNAIKDIIYTTDDYLKKAFERLDLSNDELSEAIEQCQEVIKKAGETGNKNTIEDVRQGMYDVINSVVSKVNERIRTKKGDLTGVYLRVNEESAGGYTLIKIHKEGTMEYIDIDEFGDEANHRVSGMVAGEEYIIKELQSPTGYQIAPEMVFKADATTDLKLTMVDRSITELSTGVKITPLKMLGIILASAGVILLLLIAFIVRWVIRLKRA